MARSAPARAPCAAPGGSRASLPPQRAARWLGLCRWRGLSQRARARRGCLGARTCMQTSAEGWQFIDRPREPMRPIASAHTLSLSNTHTHSCTSHARARRRPHQPEVSKQYSSTGPSASPAGLSPACCCSEGDRAMSSLAPLMPAIATVCQVQVCQPRTRSVDGRSSDATATHDRTSRQGRPRERSCSEGRRSHGRSVVDTDTLGHSSHSRACMLARLSLRHMLRRSIPRST